MSNHKPPQVNGLTVTHRDRRELKPQKCNPKLHSPKQIERIARSIRDYGWTNPAIIDE